MNAFKLSLANFISDAYGCTTGTYKGPSMEVAHKGMDITQKQYDDFVGLIAGELTRPACRSAYVTSASRRRSQTRSSRQRSSVSDPIPGRVDLDRGSLQPHRAHRSVEHVGDVEPVVGTEQQIGGIGETRIVDRDW